MPAVGRDYLWDLWRDARKTGIRQTQIGQAGVLLQHHANTTPVIDAQLLVTGQIQDAELVKLIQALQLGYKMH